MLDKIELLIPYSPSFGRHTAVLEDGLVAAAAQRHPILEALETDEGFTYLGGHGFSDKFSNYKEILLWPEHPTRLQRTLKRGGLRTGLYVSVPRISLTNPTAHLTQNIKVVVHPHPFVHFWIYHALIHVLFGHMVDFNNVRVTRFDACWDCFDYEIHSLRQHLAYSRAIKTVREYRSGDAEVQTIELYDNDTYRRVKIYDKAAESNTRRRGNIPDYVAPSEFIEAVLEEPLCSENVADTPITRIECMYQKDHHKYTNVRYYYDLFGFVDRMIQGNVDPFKALYFYDVTEMNAPTDQEGLLRHFTAIGTWISAGLQPFLYDAKTKYKAGLVSTYSEGKNFRFNRGSAHRYRILNVLEIQRRPQYFLSGLQHSLSSFFRYDDLYHYQRFSGYCNGLAPTRHTDMDLTGIRQRFAALHRDQAYQRALLAD